MTRKGVLQSPDVRERTSGAGGLLLIDVVQLELAGELPPVMEVGLHQLREVAERQGDIRHAELTRRWSRTSITGLSPSGTSGLGKFTVNA